MPFVPSERDKPAQDVVEMAREKLQESLKPFFKGKNAEVRLQDAVVAALGGIEHMLTMREVRIDPLGATVMTESAATHKKPGSTPRNI